jgi:transcriptional regulator with XRE-family HTH domain
MLVNSLADLGDLIRRRRTSLGLSQTELAEQIDSTRQWVSRLEKGKNDVSTARLFAVLEALELNLDLRPPRAAQPSPGFDPGMKSIIPAESLAAIAQSLNRSITLPDRSDMLENMSTALEGLQAVRLPDRSEILKNLSAALGGLQVEARPLGPGADSSPRLDTQSEKPDAQP